MLTFSPPDNSQGCISCVVSFNGTPIARLYRTDTPEHDLWEPGLIAPVRLPGFTVYSVTSLRTGATLSGTDRDALLDELLQRLGATTC